MSAPPPLPHAAPPKRGLSGCALVAVILVGVGVVSVPIIAILAAIAIPQYQDYTVRSRVMQGVVAAQDLQRTIDRHRAEHGRCPDAQALGMSDTATVRLSPSGEAEAVFVLDAPPAADDTSAGCGFEMRFSKLSLAADGKTIRFVSDAPGWDCRGGTLDPRFRPAQCR
ncbi:MAG: pilin [Xanthomonadaceae bacterium]|nr:pilin [Xanthomonadaceae bacterium]